MNDAPHFHLVFRPLSERMTAYSFQCDANGRVDLDRLDDGSRNDYFFARAMVGRTIRAPQVVGAAEAPAPGNALPRSKGSLQ